MSSARTAVAGAARRAVSRESVPVWAGSGILAALLVAVLALGGLNSAEPSPAQLAVGDEQRTPLYAVTVLDARLTDEVEEEYISADAGQTLVVVTVRIENLAPYPIGVGRGVDRVQARVVNVTEPLLTLSGFDTDESSYAWRTDGSSGGVVLQPRVPAEVDIVWPMPVDAVADGTATLDVYAADETRGKVILSADHVTWRRGAHVARFAVDLEGGE